MLSFRLKVAAKFAFAATAVSSGAFLVSHYYSTPLPVVAPAFAKLAGISSSQRLQANRLRAATGINPVIAAAALLVVSVIFLVRATQNVSGHCKQANSDALPLSAFGVSRIA